MTRKTTLSRGLAGRTALAAACALLALAPAVQAQNLKSYDSTKKEFWQHPPPDWFLGDETSAQKGLAPPSGPALPTPLAEVEANLKKVRLPAGFKISVYVSGVNSARQMAWGNKGTLFVGSFSAGTVYAITGTEGHRQVKSILTGLKMPTGLAYRDGALYVVDIDRILKYDDAENHLDKMPAPKVVYDDMPSYVAHGWKYLTFDTAGRLYVPFGPPCNVCLPPTSLAQVRRINPATGEAELVAIGVRNSVGGDIDPRSGDYWFTENARDWISDDLPSDKLNHVAKMGQHYGYPYCHQGDMLDPKYGVGHKCSEFTPPALNLGAHVAPLGMKFYTGEQFPGDYRNSILVTEHGSWNRHKYQGARIMRVITDPSGSSIREEEFAAFPINGDQGYTARPTDIVMAADGSVLVADDWAGAIYRISYSR